MEHSSLLTVRPFKDCLAHRTNSTDGVESSKDPPFALTVLAAGTGVAGLAGATTADLTGTAGRATGVETADPGTLLVAPTVCHPLPEGGAEVAARSA
jgi:hypothetical protein